MPNKFDLARSMIDRAETHYKAEIHEKDRNPCWYSGHKGKTKRALITARELLVEIVRDLDAPN